MWITRVSINNPVFATMVMVALCVLGIASYLRLGVEQMPDVSPPVAFVDVAYPGASPEAVERELTKVIEESLNSIAGIKRITSRSFEGRSQTSVEFSLNADMARAMQDVRDRIAVVQSAFPKDAKVPTISRFDNDNSQPVVTMALVSATRTARELSILGEQNVGKRLQSVEGVAKVDISGLDKREVRIDLDPARLRAYAVTPAEISAALNAANADQPVGLLSDATQDSILRVEGRVRDPKDFASVIVAHRSGLALTLGDLGQIVEREREPDTVARINGQRAVNFNIYKQQDANIVTTGEAVKAQMEEIRKTLPADVELRLIFASSDFVKGSLQGLQHTLVEGALLTVAIVFLFLHSWRSTIITGLTLPISVISSFIAVYAFGFTLNFMTMMALSLCIGLLIDDAIVVRENIVRHLHMGKNHHRAALEGTEEIGLAVMATTFAICAVFVPVAFMGGIVGKFFFPFGITVAVAVLVSLFVSFTLDPMLSSVWKDPPSERLKTLWGIGHLIRWTDRGLDAMHTLYERLIHWAFSGRRYRVWVPPLPAFGHPFDAVTGRRDKTAPRRLRMATITPRGVILCIGLASFVGALALAPLVGSEFIPQTDQSFTQLSVRMPIGASLARSDAKVRQVEEIVASFPEVKNVSTNVGGQGSGFSVGRSQASLNIGLVDRSERKRSQKEVEDAIREKIAKIPGIDISVGFDRPIYVTILGSDPVMLAKLSQDFADKIRKIPGTTDVELSYKPGLPAFAVRLKPGAIRELGITAPQLAASLRAYVNGEVATYWTTPDGEQVEVLLRLPEVQRERIDQMRSLPVAFAKDGTPITLETVASIEAVENPAVIRRQSLQRREAIFAGVQGRPAGDVGDDVQKLVKSTVLPAGFSFDVGGQTRDQQEAFGAMLGAMALAVVFIYIVLASQFGSFVQPIAIMASLPLALIGVMLALLFWRSTLNVFSMIGLVMLMGLVTKNAILLVDFANQGLKSGLSVADALLQAGLIRMRPILMTTAAMVFGMLPLALIGVMLALLFWRSTLNVFSMIGLVMLMGLVTKNAILLVDFANQGLKSGLSVADALLQAGLIRMRPILMTTAAMVFGMLPLALALNDGGEIQAPMGRAIIGGVITSTLLTLVVVPVIWSYLVRDKKAVAPAPAVPHATHGLQAGEAAAE